MDPLCSRKRPCGRAVLQLHQEARCQPPACKRRRSEEEEEKEEEMKRRRRRRGTGYEENRDPGEGLQRTRIRTQREHRWSPQTGARTKVRTGSGFRSGAEVQSSRQQVRVALIRKTRMQTSVQTVELRGSELVQGLILTDQTDPGSTETQLDHRRLTQDRQTRTTSEVRSRSTSDPQRTAGLVSKQSTETGTGKRRSERVLDPKSLTGKEGAPRTRSRSVGRRTKTRIRRRRKIHPSVFRGRGQLLLSITAGAGQLIIHIHEARGLMGKCQRSCDSYVQLSVTSDLSIRMKTATVLNNKNPQYNQRYTLCVSELLLNRLLVSVFRRRTDSRCSQLIGCMSFGIGSLVSSSKPVTGWFYLLGEEFGRSKHLRVVSERSQPMRRPEEEEGDLRRTPDSAPDPDLNRITSTATTSLSNCTTSTPGLEDLTNLTWTSSRPLSSGPTNSTFSSYVSALYINNNQVLSDQDGTQRLSVNIARGKDGFGFTICSDCPVRVQAVDPGGPAHQSGLRQGDSVLQLNGLPVETWKCVDLAHAIRSCPSQIVLVVWRGLPELRSGCEALLHPPTLNKTTGRKLLPHPVHSKHGRRWGQGSGVRSSLGSALGSLWRDRKEDRGEEEEEEEEEEEVAAQEVTEYSPRTTTLKGTRVTSSNGDNYIILSPVSPGGQLLQPVYHDRNRTIGHLYQTHPSRGQNLLHDSQLRLSRRPFTSRTATLPPPPSSTSSSSSAMPGNYGDYQNCTIVQSHLPCSAYGTYVTLAPKTLIFPIFVQPLDLCSPDRTLLLSEEMTLHQADLLPTKVTVLIYTDLLLLTREDEAGRCNVLQSPLYLNTLQLREVSSEPLLLYLLQMSQTCCCCVFSLESFSIEQKVRVRLCLHDNIHHQLVAPETAHSHQPSDLPSDFGLLSLGQSDLLYRPSSPYSSSDPPLFRPSSPYSSLCDALRPPSPSPYTPRSPFSSSTSPPPFSSLSPYTSSSSSPPSRNINAVPHLLLPPPSPLLSSIQRSPVWKERGRTEEEERMKRRRREEEEVVEERQQGEGESASETSENVGGVGGLLLSPTHFNMKEEEESDDEEEGGGAEVFSSTYRPAVLRRSLSEGSLLQEPRSPRFLSDSTIHQLTRLTTFDLDPSSDHAPQLPSPHTLRKQLTREGGSLHHMLLLLNGSKNSESRNLQLRKKTKSLAADVRSRLAFLRRRKNSCFHGNSLEKALRNNRPSPGEVLRWAESLEALLTNQYGLAVFRHFLRSEFSEENLDFWLAVERFKKTHSLSKMAAKAAKIYEEFISTNATRQVNVDSSVRESTNQSLRLGINSASFQLAQDQIFGLMEADSYPRFLRSCLYTQLTNQGTQLATILVNQGEAGSVSQS
ncbi:regulator of G-protein signaling 3 isoform X2 [Lates calcarifer]|uniref:Regulator of G-protein signaling 3 isoform X2 n=1 Tax=Lates calcarifer TaxID=8187 RepID=A0AAJ7Q6P5_LATCA|nr:regulator of G-protein signaling 3 isoform X2 [Lates calcarifer]